MKPGDTIWVRGVIEVPDDAEYPDCVHVAFDESGCSVYLDRREQFVPADRVLDDADVAAWGRMVEISQLAQALLLMHGAFGQPWPNNDIGRRLTGALEAITLPHDWERYERIAADAARTEAQP